MIRLFNPDSPLSQVSGPRRINMSASKRPLNLDEQHTVKRILDEKCDYVDNPLFDLPKEQAKQQIFNQAPDIDRPDTSWYHPMVENLAEVRNTRKTSTTLLTAKQEQSLFIQFNYCRMRICHLRDTLKQQIEIDPDAAREMLKWNRRASSYRDQIAAANIALVLAMAKRTKLSYVDFADLISEGNMALLRSIDKFDASRGFKFSTYACRAILKSFSRAGMKLSKYRNMFPVDFDPKLERSNYSQEKRARHEYDCADEVRLILDDNRADLSDLEQDIIEHRFAIGSNKTKNSVPMTLKQVGKEVGLTKERVRQIQKKAMAKIRVTLEDEYLR